MNPQTLADMPKAELDIHIEATIQPDLLRTLAERNGLPVPASVQDQKPYAIHDASSFNSVYNANIDVLRTARDFDDITTAFLAKCRKLNIIHVEIAFAPQMHTSRGVEFKTVVQGLHEAAERAWTELGVSALLIMNLVPDKGLDSALATLDEAKPHKAWIAGVALGSLAKANETPPNKFADLFKRAREQGYKLAVRCDPDHPDGGEHVRQAIEDIAVDRVENGMHVAGNQVLVETLLEKGLALTCCPVSNKVLTGNSRAMEILALVRQGVCVTLSSDAPAYFHAYLNDNVSRVISETGVKRSEVVKMQRNAFSASWLGPERLERLIGTFNQWIISVELAG